MLTVKVGVVLACLARVVGGVLTNGARCPGNTATPGTFRVSQTASEKPWPIHTLKS